MLVKKWSECGLGVNREQCDGTRTQAKAISRSSGGQSGGKALTN
jgi:hypothetical protein